MNFAAILQFVLFLFEYLAWQVHIPGYTNHIVSGHEKFGYNVFFLVVQINSLPHLLGALAFSRRSPSRFFSGLYLLYLILWTGGQVWTWWLPYFFSIGFWHQRPELMASYHRTFSELVRVLPRWKNHEIIPDLEHTLLFPLTLLTLLVSFWTWSSFWKRHPSSSSSSDKTKVA